MVIGIIKARTVRMLDSMFAITDLKTIKNFMGMQSSEQYYKTVNSRFFNALGQECKRYANLEEAVELKLITEFGCAIDQFADLHAQAENGRPCRAAAILV